MIAYNDNDGYPPDQVGEATDLARRFAADLRVQLLIVSGITSTDAERKAQAWAAGSTWPVLCREMARLATLAPNAAARGQGDDDRLQDFLEARGLVNRAPERQALAAALFADAVTESLRAANVLDIPRSERVDHLAAAFKAWPALCRAAVDVIPRPERKAA